MYVLALSDYKLIFKSSCRRGDEAADKIAVYRVKVFLFELF